MCTSHLYYYIKTFLSPIFFPNNCQRVVFHPLKEENYLDLILNLIPNDHIVPPSSGTDRREK